MSLDPSPISSLIKTVENKVMKDETVDINLEVVLRTQLKTNLFHETCDG